MGKKRLAKTIFATRFALCPCWQVRKITSMGESWHASIILGDVLRGHSFANLAPFPNSPGHISTLSAVFAWHLLVQQGAKGTDMTEWLISPHWQFKMAQDFRTSKVDVVFLMFRSHPDMGKVKDLQQVESENQTFYRMFLMWRRSVSGALEVVHIAEEESLSMQLTRLVLLVGSVNLSSSESNGLFPKAVMTVARKARRRSEVVFNHTVFHSFVLGSVWGIGNIQIIVWN